MYKCLVIFVFLAEELFFDFRGIAYLGFYCFLEDHVEFLLDSAYKPNGRSVPIGPLCK